MKCNRAAAGPPERIFHRRKQNLPAGNHRAEKESPRLESIRSLRKESANRSLHASMTRNRSFRNSRKKIHP
jgi:hypothetical protein